MKSQQLTVESHSTVSSHIPTGESWFVPSENQKIIDRILRSKNWIPTLVTGPKGSGKNMAIMQACAAQKRACIRFSVTGETSEYELLGGDRLRNGTQQFFDGPVTAAARTGNVLILDEIDFASERATAALHAAMEGKGLTIPTTGEYVKIDANTKIFLTANTKGRGDFGGKYYGARVLNSAFLERIKAIINFTYNTVKQDEKAMTLRAQTLDIDATKLEDLIPALSTWAQNTRTIAAESNDMNPISTRCLISILEVYETTEDVEQAIRLSLGLQNPDEIEGQIKAFMLGYNRPKA
jgi:MoxR-like ATPase